VRHTLHVELDDDADRALRVLVASGMTEAEAVRQALVEAAAARRRPAALRAECRRLNASAEDRADKLRILAQMDSHGPDWPD